MGYMQEYRNGYSSTAMVENADLAESVDMIEVIAGLSMMRVLNNKSYSSSPRFYHFVKYRIPIKEQTRNRRNEFDRYALVNQSEIYENIDDKEIEDIIRKQIQMHTNDSRVRKKWENTKSFMDYVSGVSDVNLFL